MESQRLILVFVFAFSLFLLVDAWQKDQHPQPASTQSAAKKDARDPTLPPAPSEKLAAPPTAAGPASPPSATALATGAKVTVETDLFIAEISTAGGDLRRLELKAHRATENTKARFVLLDERPDHLYVAQSGLLGDLPNHRTQFAAQAAQYKLGEGAATVDVRLEAAAVNGVKVTKTYRFHRGSYVVDVDFEVTNQGAAAIQPYGYF